MRFESESRSRRRPGPRRLHACIRQAFGFAKAGAASNGYLLLVEGKEQAERVLSPEDPDAPELLRGWDTALQWLEQRAPTPM